MAPRARSQSQTGTNPLAPVEAYYSAKIAQFGPGPLGVDWASEPTQHLRLVQLLKLCDFSQAFSLNDLGCGYGALLTLLRKRYPHQDIDYLGIDLSQAMLRHAQKRWATHRFVRASTPPRVADYGLASGIFNIKLETSHSEWERQIASSLQALNATSRRGFSVNFLETIPAVMETSALYGAAPERWVLYCENTFDATVELIRNYGLSEYSLLVRKA